MRIPRLKPLAALAPLRSLRWRIVVIAAALVAASSIVIGGVTLIALHGYLLAQVDERLISSTHRVERISGQLPTTAAGQGAQPPAPSSGTGSSGGTDETGQTGQHAHPKPPVGDFVGVPGQSAQTVVAVMDGGDFVVSGFVDDTGTQHSLTAHARKVLATAAKDTRPTTLDLGGSLGRYRVASQTDPNGSTVITGLPLGAVDSAVWRVAGVILAVVLVAIAAAAAVGAVVLGRSLRPLRRVAATASAVTDVPLDRGDVRLDARVADADLRSTAEVGQVGGALNALLEHVGDALAVRHASEQTMRRFVADASHELRTPLATVRAYAQLSAREHPELPDDLERNIARIDRESVRMGELVDQLLLLARLDAGAAAGHAADAPAQDEVNLSLLVAETAGDARLAASDHTWVLDLDAEPVVARGDAAQLRRLVTNLLANARTHTPAGTTVRVSLHGRDGQAVLAVADDGPGVPAELQPTVFDRFARGDAARNRDGGSTGLGLAIVKAIAEAHGGSVALESEPGRTVFTVRLPAAD